MPRSTHLEYPGALYHVTSRGVQRCLIFRDDRDRQELLKLLSSALKSFDARALAYCLMGNHYHFVIQTRRANLSTLMQRINATYGQAFNRRHQRSGHLFEGRFKAILVDRDNYLLKVCRYVDLNPVRAGLVESAAQWRWSSHRAHTGAAPIPHWLATGDLLGALTGRVPANEAEFEAARERYAEWVAEGRGSRLWSEALRDGEYLGDAAFVERVNRSVALERDGFGGSGSGLRLESRRDEETCDQRSDAIRGES